MHDIVKKELGDDWKQTVTGIVGGGSSNSGPMSLTDPRRNQYCGLSWGQASTKCHKWCMGEEKDACPRGQKCFADTTCYYDDDIQPSMSPISTWSPTRSPIFGVSKKEILCISFWQFDEALSDARNA